MDDGMGPRRRGGPWPPLQPLSIIGTSLSTKWKPGWTVGEKVEGLSLDLHQAFDGVPRALTVLMAERLGLPRQMTELWRHQLARQVRHFKINGCVQTHSVRPRRGVAQGEAYALLAQCLNSFVWRRLIHRIAPSAQAQLFAENWAVISRGGDMPFSELLRVCEAVQAWTWIV